MRKTVQAGFSMVEMVVAVMLASILAGFALINLAGIAPGTAANAALSQTVAQLRQGRDLAVAQRRRIQLTFAGNNQIQLARIEEPNGNTTVLSTVTLQGGIRFQLFGNVLDTPDSFGKAAAVDFGGANAYVFLSDGTLVDGNYNPINGSVFLGQPGRSDTARAVTVLGATGRVRGYRWTGVTWIQ